LKLASPRFGDHLADRDPHVAPAVTAFPLPSRSSSLHRHRDKLRLRIKGEGIENNLSHNNEPVGFAFAGVHVG
jgi:hypothetical protein